DGGVGFEERANFPPEEIGDGLGHDVHGQGIAPVSLNQTRPLLWGADQLMADQQLLASRSLQAIQAQGAHRRLSTFQPWQRGGFFPAGQQQATVVPGLGHLPQQVPIGFNARAESVGAGVGALPTSAPPLSSTGTGVSGGDGCLSKAASQASS